MFRRILLVACATLATVAADVQAGTYTVHGCRLPNGQPGAPIGDAQYGWHPGSTHGSFRYGNQCDQDFGNAFLYAGGDGEWTSGYGHHSIWQFTPPPSTTIAGFRVWWAGSAVSELSLASTSIRLNWGTGEMAYNDEGFGTLTNAFSSLNLADVSGIDRSSMYAWVVCDRVEGCTGSGNPAHSIGFFRLYKSEFDLRDLVSPTGEATGSAISEATWSGFEGVAVSARDAGAGVYRVLLDVDGATVAAEVIDDAAGRCADATPGTGSPYEFLDVRPCLSQVASDVTFDSTAISDGAHAMRIYVEDAAGNRSLIAGPLTRTVDNIPPPANTRRPVVSGTPRSGSSLSGDDGAWSGGGVSFAHSWQRCDLGGATCADIAGASGRSYVADAGDVGKTLRLRVRATSSEGSTDAFSDPTAAVTAGDGGGATVSRDGAAPPVVPGELPSGTPNGVNASPLALLDARENGTERRIVRVRYGRRVVVAGRLAAPGGAPITGATLDVVSQDRVSSAPLVALGVVKTDLSGRFRFVATPGASRKLRFAYRARIGDLQYAQTTEVDLRVIAKLGFRLGRQSLRNGKTLRYLGRIYGPRTGHRFVEVQVRQGKRWTVVCSVRTDARGSYACAHRFTRTFTRTKYRFRARVRRQTGLPYEPATSRSRSIVVRP